MPEKNKYYKMAYKKTVKSNEQKPFSKHPNRITLISIFVVVLIWFLLWLFEWVRRVFPNTALGKSLFGSANIGNQGLSTDKISVINKYNTIRVTEEIEGSNLSHIHIQENAADVWIIRHNFRAVPNITVLAPDGISVLQGTPEHFEEMVTDEDGVEYLAYMYCTISFGSPEAGKALLNI